MNTKTFWILWNPQGTMPPKKRFDTFREAKEVAELMQLRLGEGQMYVLKAVGVATVCTLSDYESFGGTK